MSEGGCDDVDERGQWHDEEEREFMREGGALQEGEDSEGNTRGVHEKDAHVANAAHQLLQ